MAEDGMLVNFSLANSVFNTKPVYKGGTWKDRLTAKKVFQYRQHKAQITDSVIGAAIPDHANTVNGSAFDKAAKNITNYDFVRPAKRQKTEDTYLARPRQGGTTKGPQEIVSSLFSFNPPSSSLTPGEEHQDVPQADPTNAPLVDGLDTFTSLGLSTNLASHLLIKLSLKAPTAIQKAAISQLIKENSDAFIQAETGSGKTLAYLLPIVQRIMELSPKQDPEAVAKEGSRHLHRDSGLFAIVLAPTRELCKQISMVLDKLLNCAHWIVAGTVIGGEKKKSEKARLRKGLNILVATPGRLADHLNNTEALDVSNVRWLILDEGDRLMELGFEEEIQGIVAKLDQQFRPSPTITLPSLPTRRTTLLCSATMKMHVQRLGEISLRDAVYIKADPEEAQNELFRNGREVAFSAPAQLKQSYILVPAKQRLVTLTALLRQTFSRRGSAMKAIVFFSCADTVDFHFALFARKDKEDTDENDSDRPEKNNQTANAESEHCSAFQTPQSKLPTISPAPSLTTAPQTPLTLHKLHGTLTQPLRTATLAAFARTHNPSILLCTDVASRGLDVPEVDFVIEYDPPFNADDHLHRVGRTARAGKGGKATIFLMPGSEEGYVEILKQGYKDGVGKGLVRTVAEEVLRKGFGGKGWEEAATEWQLRIERWVSEERRAADMARKAFTSQVRAYATHVVEERAWFDVKLLHLGHLAKAFALRERPGNMGVGRGLEKRGRGDERKKLSVRRKDGDDVGRADELRAERKADLQVEGTDGQEAARKMRKKMKEHMAGANEFNIG